MKKYYKIRKKLTKSKNNNNNKAKLRTLRINARGQKPFQKSGTKEQYRRAVQNRRTKERYKGALQETLQNTLHD